MIKTLSDYNLLENEEWKDSINTLFLELRSKLPEFFKEVPLPTIPHEDYVEVVIPASKQVMMEDLVEWMEKKLGLHILYASKQNYGKLLKAAAYSTPVDGSMFIIHMGSEQYGVIDSLTVHFYDSDETMLLGIQHVLRDVTRVPAEVLEYQRWMRFSRSFSNLKDGDDCFEMAPGYAAYIGSLCIPLLYQA